jgi:serine/threonine protein kinase
MATSASCPSVDRLRLLLHEAPPADQEDLIAHVGTCSHCQEALEHLAGATSGMLAAAGDLERTLHMQGPPVRRLLQDLATNSALTRLYRPTAPEGWLQSLLRPGHGKELLGHLDKFEVTEVLGQGGMGIVLKACDRPLNRWVALKVLPPNLAGDAVARQRFEREARAAAAVDHPNVITIYAVNEVNGLPYLVMEYIAGGSLQDEIDCHGPPDWRTTAQLGVEIASGLAAAHARGLVHRDIKPSNILLQNEAPIAADGSAEKGGPGGEQGLGAVGAHPPHLSSSAPHWVAKICDFGLARAVDEARLTQSGITPGTPMYMAPEQAQNEPIDARADLFSLGNVLYTLCTGQEPFEGSSVMAVLRQVCDVTPRPIRELNPSVPAWLTAIVECLQAKRPADRFATAAEVAELLRYNLAHPEQPRLPPARPQWRGKKRWLGAIVLLLFLLAGGALWMRWAGDTSAISPATQREGLPVPLQATLSGHTGPVWSVAISPDGQTVATGGDDSTVRLWGLSTGQQEAVLPGQHNHVAEVAFAHSGKFLLSGDSDGVLHRWDVAMRKETGSYPHHGGSVRALVISPDDTTVAVPGSQAIELWDLRAGTVRLSLVGPGATVTALAYAPDGKTLAVGDSNGFIQFWDTISGSAGARFQAEPQGVRALAYLSGGEVLVSAGTGARDVKLWKVGTQEMLQVLPETQNGIVALAIDPEGALIAAGCRDGMVQIWRLSTGNRLASWQAHQGDVMGVAFSPNGRTLATASRDRLAKLWDLGQFLTAAP